MTQAYMRARLALLSAVVLIGCTGQKTAEEYLKNANLHFENGDLSAALIEIRNAVSQAPTHGDARALLGRLELKKGNPTSAESNLLKALELGVPKADLLVDLSQVYAVLGKLEDLSQIDLIGQSDEIKSQVLGYQAVGAIARGDFSEARRLLETALDLNAASSIALVTSARLHLIDRNVPAARSNIASSIKNDSSYSPAWELLGDIDASEASFSDALSAYSRAIETSVTKVSPLIKRARIHLELKDSESVFADINALEEIGAHISSINLIKGEALLKQEKFADAQQALEELLKSAPDYQPAVRLMAITHLIRDNLGQAEQYAKQYFEATPSDDSYVLLASIRLQAGRFKQAEQTLIPLARSGQLSTLGFQVLATTQLKQGNIDGAVDSMLALHSKLTRANNHQTGSLAIKADPATLVSEEILGKQPQNSSHTNTTNYLSESNLKLIDTVELLARKDYSGALKSAKVLIATEPNNADLHSLLARIHASMGNTDTALAALERAIKLEPSNDTADFLRAMLYAKTGDPNQARTILERALTRSSGFNRERFYLGLISVDQSTGDEESAFKRLVQAQSENPSSYQLSLALAYHFATKFDPVKVLESLSELSGPGLQNSQVVNFIVQAHIALKEFNKATDILNPMINSEPDRAIWRFLRAKAKAGTNDIEAAERDLNVALRIDPNHTLSKLAKANISILTNNLEQAELQLAQLESLIPDTEALSRLSSRIETVRNIDEQEAPIANSDETTRTIMGKARAYWSSGDQNKALNTLQDWVDSNPNDVAVHLTLANTLVSLDRHKEALRKFRTVLDLDANNFIALNNLAWQLRLDDPSSALTYARRAIKIEPNNMSALDTLAVIQLEQGLITEAGKTFKIIRALQPKDPTILFHGAKILAALGEKAEAKSIIAPLVLNNVDFPEAEAARALLSNL